MSDERGSAPAEAPAAVGDRDDHGGSPGGSGSREAAIESLAFDEAFEALQQAVTELEAGGQPLEVTIALYERAVDLQRHCERLLGQAELRVRQLMARPGGPPTAVDVSPEEAVDAGDPGA